MTQQRRARRGVDGEIIAWERVPDRARELDLEPHPEGGWYRRTWASPAAVETPGGTRAAATMILFLLPPGEASAWHVVTSDEMWLWHGPGSVTIEHGGTGAVPQTERADVLDTAHPQVLVRAGVWQRTIESDVEALVSCVVSPGFDFADFTLA